ncbi:MAG: right-handed parallel beta-helix repeat-containing protein, partial [Phaeodactylibacter sp.]|nr:right-handed parallel beta-helix repeat-containing protein [Phaeodactylibacter sp.]
MKKKHSMRSTPPLLDILFFNVLVAAFLLSGTGPVVGQAVFQADILETGDPARKVVITQQMGVNIEEYWIVDIDVAALDSLIQAQGSNIDFQFKVGTQFQWSLSLAESFAATVGTDTLWTKYTGEADSDPDKPVNFVVSEAYFEGGIQEPFFTYQFLSMYEFSPLDSNYSDKHVLVEKKTEAQAASTCSVPYPNVPGTAAVVEVAIVVDQGIYNFFNNDEDFVRNRAASTVFDAFSFYFNYNNIPVGPEIREIIIRKDEPLDCGDNSEVGARLLSKGLSDFWNRSRPCAANVLDAFIVFTGQDCFRIGAGQSTTIGICPQLQPGSAIPIDYPLSVIEVPGHNLSGSEGISFNTAHEIGHLLTGRDHLENDMDYETSCPGISSACFCTGCLFPIMCDEGGRGDRTFDAVYIDDCTCAFIAQTIAQRTVVGECLYPPDESSIPELPCDTCTVFLDIEIDNEEPVIGCEGQDEVNYTVTLCNYCQPDTFNLEVVQFNPEDEILLTQGLNVTEGNDRFIRVDGIELGFDECYELNFSTRVIDVPLSTIGTEVRVDSIENEVVVEDIAVEGILLNPQALNPVDFENVSGLLTQEPALPGPGTNCEGSLYLDNIRVFNTFEANIGAGNCFTFRNSLIELEPGAQIVVSSGNLVLDGCRIFGCSELWESITVEDGASLEMRNCTVSDAENAVTLEAGAQAEIRNNTFRNNYTGILMGLQPGQTASLRNCYGNTFLADGALKAPRSGTTAFAGIWLDNASASVGVAGQAPNVFDGLYDGILARNSNLRVTNATFRNLLGDASQPGRGIHAFGSPTGYYLLYVSGDEGRPVLFDNCATGIRASGVNAYVFNTVMDGVNTGLRLASCRDKNL